MSSGEYPLELDRAFGLVTVEMFCAATGCTENAAAKQLRASGLHRFPLTHPRCYWATKPLGPLSLPVRYGVACYCLLGQTRRTPSRDRSLSCGGEVLCSDGRQIEAVRVDLGGTPSHVARKALAFVRRNESRDLSAIRYVILVPTPERGQALGKALDQHRWPLSFKVAVIPDLLGLIPQER